MHPPSIPGKPDFVFPRIRLAVFVDGCFWHGCRQCRNLPASNRAFWKKKITANVRRDRKIVIELRGDGWAVLRFWEHQIRTNPNECVDTLQRLLKIRRRRKIAAP